MKATGLLFLIMISSNILFAQQITGKIVDEHNNPLEFANIVLLSLPDSTFITGTVSDVNGHFYIKEKITADACLRITLIGYTTKIIPAESNRVITLKPQAFMLNDVVIKAERIKRNPNGYVVNLKNDRSVKGKKTDELLTQLPGITSEDGSLKILFQSASAIYLNGVKIKNEQELQAIPADYLESVEVNYMAGSDEMASAQGGIIRIKLKKENEGGYSGNLFAEIQEMPEYGHTGENISNVFSYQYKKLNVYNVISFRHNQAIGDTENNRWFKESESLISSKEKYRNWYKYFYDRLSLTYDIKANHTLGISFFYANNNENPTRISDTKITENEQIAEQHSVTRSPYRYNMYQGTFNYNWTIGKKGTAFSLTADYLRNNERQTLTSQLTEPTIVTDGDSRSRQNTDMFRIKPAFVLPFNKNSKLIAGVDYQYIRTKLHLTDHIHTDQNEHSTMYGYVPAIFSSFSGRKKALQYEVGLRVQQNKMKYVAEETGTSTQNSNWGVFPSASLMYMLNGKKGHLINLQYKRMMDDIPYSLISPYKLYESPNFYTRGNPDLISPTSHQVMGMMVLFNKISLMGGYIYYKDQIYYATEVDPDSPNVSYSIPRNGDHQSLKLFGLEGRFQLFKWWKIKAIARLVLHSAESATFSVHNQDKYYFALNNTFEFTPSFGAGINCFYEPDYHYMDRIYKQVCDVSGNIYKRFFDNKLEIQFRFKPYRKGRILLTDTPEYESRAINNTKEEYIRFSLTYFFKGGKKVNVKRTESIQSYEKIEDTK